MDWLPIISAILVLWVITTLGLKAVILHGLLRVTIGLAAIILISMAFLEGALILGDYIYSGVPISPPIPAFAIYPLMLFLFIFWYVTVRATWKWTCR
jgi:hypothetical protein